MRVANDYYLLFIGLLLNCSASLHLFIFPRCLEIQKKILAGFQVCCLQVVLHVLDSQGAPADCLSRMTLAIAISPVHLLWMMWILLIAKQGNSTCHTERA